MRFILVVAGRRSGKTESSKRRLVRHLPIPKEWPDPRYFFGAPTRDQAKKIAWQDLKSLTPPHWVKQIYDGDLIIRTKFGSELHVVGLDKPARVEGIPWDGCVVDESSDIKPKTFDLTILPALADRNGWCVRQGVPKRTGVGAAEFKKAFQAAQRGDIPNTAAFHWVSAGILSPEIVEDARLRLDARDFNEQFNATFESAGGAVYHAFTAEYNVRPCGYDPNRPLIVGSDFNVDPMAWVLGHIRDGRLEIFDELFLRDANTPMALDVLHDRFSNHRGGFEFYGDATGQARRTSAKQSDYEAIAGDHRFMALGRTVHYPAGNPAQADRYASVNAMLCNARGDRRLFVDPRCEHLRYDLENGFYKPGTREAMQTEDLSHPSDALGYIVHYRFPIPGFSADAEEGQFNIAC